HQPRWYGVWMGLLSTFLGGCNGPGHSLAGNEPPANTYRAEIAEFSGTRQSIHTAVVTPEFFPAVKVQPMIGRLFRPDEHQPGKELVVVVCRRFWEHELGGDPAWIGKPLHLNGRDFTIVGVLPSGLDAPAGTDVWIPELEPATR